MNYTGKPLTKSKSLKNKVSLRTLCSLLAIAVTSSFSSGVLAQSSTTSYLELSSRIKAPGAVERIGADLFGDQVNLYNGKLEFIQVDVNLSGNNSLPVMAGRHFYAGNNNQYNRAFAQWDLEIPHLHGVFSQTLGWVTGTKTLARCSNFEPPAAAVGTNNIGSWDPSEYWQGNFMYIPGAGDQLLLKRDAKNTVAPGGPTATANYPVVTAKAWSLSCLASLANDSTQGEGFLAVGPDGTQYRFDQIVSFSVLGLQKSNQSSLTITVPTEGDNTNPATSAGGQASVGVGAGSVAIGQSPLPNALPNLLLQRKEVWILPTKVTDRFGNTVTYLYDTVNPGNILSITASDGRKLTFSYYTATTGGATIIKSISDGTRTWTYNYTGSRSATGPLIKVILPDSSVWDFSYFSDPLNGDIVGRGGSSCEAIGFEPTTKTGSITHPSGAVGVFTLTPTAHGRSNVNSECLKAVDGSTVPTAPKYFATESLTSKSISGPGLPSMSWAYSYSDATQDASFAPCTACKSTKSVYVTDPEGNVTMYTYGNRYLESEGQLQQVDKGWNGSSSLQTTMYQYRTPDIGPYPGIAGYSYAGVSGDSDQQQRYMPLETKSVLQQNETFTWHVTDWDATIAFPRATAVLRSSSLGYSRNDTTVYSDNLAKYVLGQVGKVTTAGIDTVSNTYDTSTANLLTVRHFSHLDQTFTYNADGTIATKKDGNSKITTYTNYKLGIPQKITYPDGYFESAVVNDIGLISSFTNGAGSTFGYGYDTLGRLASVTYPTADTVAWNGTSITFSKASTPYNDLAAGHWQQEIITGTGHTVVHYDAFWRPAYTDRWDLSDQAGTERVVKQAYDSGGNKTFESYPQRTASTTTTGTSTKYDALSRPMSIIQDSEINKLTSSYSYGDHFETTFWNNRGHQTIYAYQAFDEPVTSTITQVSVEGVDVDIARDLFGKALSIKRTDGTNTVTKSYVYDAYQRLCKTIEPETKATIQDYDLANNVAWRAPGLNYLSTTTCNTTDATAVNKILYGYDPVNQLLTTTYGDKSSPITRTYTGDGLLGTVTSNGAVWTYTYNKRRLNERESLAYGGVTYNVDRSYDGNGSLAQLTYPVDKLTVAYSPNALGEATTVGTYASAIARYPNGAVASFTYGNGIKHSMAQNARGLPGNVIDAGVINDQYSYDENANVTGIADNLIVNNLQGTYTRTMTYDALDRLWTAGAPNLWGTAAYTYDGLDNLTSTTITSGATARSVSHNIDRTTNLLSSITNGPPAFNLAYLYDARGNISKRGSTNYVFDLGNRMSAATGLATYQYDGLGRRVSVVGADGQNRVQVYSQAGQLLYATSGTVNPTKYIYLDSHVIAEVK